MILCDGFVGQTAAAGYTGGYDQTAAAAAKPATYATTYTQRTGQQQAQAAVSFSQMFSQISVCFIIRYLRLSCLSIYS